MHNVQVEVSKWQHSSAESDWHWPWREPWLVSGSGIRSSEWVTTRSSVACTSLVLPLNYSARRVLNWGVGGDSAVSYQTPSFVLNVTRTLNEKRRNYSRARRISEVLSRWSNQRINELWRPRATIGLRGRQNWRKLVSCSAKERLGCHAGYDGWRTRCHFCDLKFFSSSRVTVKKYNRTSIWHRMTFDIGD